jgi:hypothetical protein
MAHSDDRGKRPCDEGSSCGSRSPPPHQMRSVVVILQPNTWVNFAIVFGDVAWLPETSQKMSVAHGAPKCLGTRPFGAKAASFAIIMAPSMWVHHTWLELRTVTPWACRRYVRGSDRTLGHFPHLEPLGWPSIPHP